MVTVKRSCTEVTLHESTARTCSTVVYMHMPTVTCELHVQLNLLHTIGRIPRGLHTIGRIPRGAGLYSIFCEEF